MVNQQTYTPPPLPAGKAWAPNALPVRFNPTSSLWEVFFNSMWQPRRDWTTESVNALGRQGQVFQVGFATSGGSANTAAVQRAMAVPSNSPVRPASTDFAPSQIAAPPQQPTPNQRIFAPDGAQLSPEGSILSRPNQNGLTAPSGEPYSPEQLATLYNLPNAPERTTAPDGTPYTPEQLQTLYNGGAGSLPGSGAGAGAVRTGQAAPVPPDPSQPTRPNDTGNPAAKWNPQTQSWNVDAADTWNQPMSAAPPAPPAKALGAAPEPVEMNTLIRDARAGAPSGVERDPNQPMSQQQMWLEWLLNGNPLTQGEQPVPRFATGGMEPIEGEFSPMPELPSSPMTATPPVDAVVGEGMEAAHPQFDNPARGELLLEAMPNLGPDIWRVTHAEGATGVDVGNKGLLVLPLSDSAEEIAAEHISPAKGVKGKMKGNTFESGPLSIPTEPGGNGSSGKVPAFAEGTGDYYYAGQQAQQNQQAQQQAQQEQQAAATAAAIAAAQQQQAAQQQAAAPPPAAAPPTAPPQAGAMTQQQQTLSPVPPWQPTPPPPVQSPTGDFATNPTPTGVIRGTYLPQSVLGPSEEWQGLPGGAPPPVGNLTQFARTSEEQRRRFDQMLKSYGLLGGIQAIEADLRRSAPGRLGMATYAG